MTDTSTTSSSSDGRMDVLTPSATMWLLPVILLGTVLAFANDIWAELMVGLCLAELYAIALVVIAICLIVAAVKRSRRPLRLCRGFALSIGISIAWIHTSTSPRYVVDSIDEYERPEEGRSHYTVHRYVIDRWYVYHEHG